MKLSDADFSGLFFSGYKIFKNKNLHYNACLQIESHLHPLFQKQEEIISASLVLICSVFRNVDKDTKCSLTKNIEREGLLFKCTVSIHKTPHLQIFFFI